MCHHSHGSCDPRNKEGENSAAESAGGTSILFDESGKHLRAAVMGKGIWVICQHCMWTKMATPSGNAGAWLPRF